MFRFRLRTIVIALAAALAWTAASPSAWAGTLTGTATYRERIALPPDAVFEAALQDVSRADAPAIVLGRARLAPAGSPPFRFSIPYVDEAIRPRRRYTVRATIRQGDRLLFTTDRAYPAFETGRPLALTLVRVQSAPGAGAQASQPITGMFVYMADAAAITLCVDGRRVPVAMEGDFKALQRAYGEARPQPGQPMLVSVEGRITPRPSAEESQPPRPTLVVDRFLGVWPRETCGTPGAESPLRGVYWKLVRLGGAPVQAFDNQQEPHLLFATGEPRISGSGGCNRLMGGFELSGDRLRLGRVAATRRACPEGMEQEQRFLRAMQAVATYRIRGSHLDLLDAKGESVARFEAVALR